MRKAEMLWAILQEELAEVIQEVAKLLRFGPGEIMPGQELTNLERVVNELNDLWAMVAMIANAGHIPEDWLSPERQHRKAANVAKYLDYSRQCGTLEEDGVSQ